MSEYLVSMKVDSRAWRALEKYILEEIAKMHEALEYSNDDRESNLIRGEIRYARKLLKLNKLAPETPDGVA